MPDEQGYCTVEQSHALPIEYVAVMLPMALVLIAESVITLYICRKNFRIREKPSSQMLTSLAVSGGLIGIVLTYFTVVKLVMPSKNLIFRSLSIECIPRTLHIVSVLMLCCLTLDRYVALCWPLRYHDLLTPFRSTMLVVGCWVFVTGILFAPATTLNLLSDSPDLRLLYWIYTVVFFSAVLFMVILYCFMAWEFWQNKHQVVRVSEVMERENYRIRLKTAIDVIIVVSLNLLLSFPDVIFRLLCLMDILEYRTTKHITPCLLLLHQLVFLPLYVWRNADFREALQRCWASFRTTCGCDKPALSSSSSSNSSSALKTTSSTGPHTTTSAKTSFTTLNTAYIGPRTVTEDSSLP